MIDISLVLVLVIAVLGLVGLVLGHGNSGLAPLMFASAGLVYLIEYVDNTAVQVTCLAIQVALAVTAVVTFANDVAARRRSRAERRAKSRLGQQPGHDGFGDVALRLRVT